MCADHFATLPSDKLRVESCKLKVFSIKDLYNSPPIDPPIECIL